MKKGFFHPFFYLGLWLVCLKTQAMRKDVLNSYLYFTKKERTALLLLVILTMLFFILPFICTSPAGAGTAARESDSLLQKQAFLPPARYSGKKHDSSSGRSGTRYPPHGSARSSLEKSGYIYYRYPYPRRPEKKDRRGSHTAIPSEVPINTTDSAGLLPLPGIGPVLAGRIISFRDKLGGFYNVEQVRDTYGLPDSTFQRIRGLLRVDTTCIRQMDLNQADPALLAAHPYIRAKLARIILEYRRQHEGFGEVKDLLKIAVITPAIFDRIAPYCKTTQ